MSIDTSERVTTGGEGGHHFSPVETDRHERLGVWLFIGADVIILAALLFTYLYLRGVNTGGHWMSLLGYRGNAHTYAWFDNAADAGTLKAPTNITTAAVSAGLQWLIVVLTVASAGIAWVAEKGLRTTKNAKAYSSLIFVAALVALLGVVFSAVLLHGLPQVFVAANDSLTMSYTTYDSSMMAILGSILFHLFVVGFLGIGMSIRAARGLVTGEKWYQARLVRIFWVWLAVGSIISTLITTLVVKV